MEHNWRRRQNNLGASRESLTNENSRRHFNNGENRYRSRQNNRDNTQGNRNRSHSRNPSHRNNNREDNGQSSNDRNSNKKRWVGFRYIENLLDRSSEDIIMQLMNNCNGLKQLTKEQLSGDFVVLLVKLSKKVCQSAFSDTKYTIIQVIFSEPFLNALTTFIAMLPTQNEQQRRHNSWFWKDTDEFWNNLLDICEDLLNAIPTVGCKICGEILNVLKMYLPLFETKFGLHIADEINKKIDFLLESTEILKIEVEQKAADKRNKNTADNYDIEPPDDFRAISIYPSPTELKGDREFLRPNIVDGAYKNIDHYLDIQFRLLREDFVAPLRKGIQNYLFNMTATNKIRLENIRIYNQVRFLRPETVGQNYSIRIRFDFSKKKKSFSYENSKRFMFGSLLCFTNDLFQTILFGRVEQRKLEDLKNGELVVGFDNPIDVLFDRDYLMVESNVYFEPYYHVLSVLQILSVDYFPMEKYLIYCQSDVTPPRYLPVTKRLHLINMGLSGSNAVFNESQLRAFTAALTQEFVLIQGPPGTGKTYVGLKIAKSLLEMRDHWDQHSPMLVICFTNHALDQFLEGLLPTTKNLIRVGGQSKNENLKNYNLRERKKTGRRRRDAAIIDKTLEIRRTLGEIKSWKEHLHDLEQYDSVITFNAFRNVIDGFETSWFSKATNENVFEWLFGGRDVQEDDENPDIIHKMDTLKITGAVGELPEDENEGSDDDDDDDDDGDADNDEHPTAALDDEIFDDNFDRIPLLMACNLTSSKKIKREIDALESKFTEIEATEAPPLEKILLKTKIEQELKYLHDNYDYLQKRLQQGRQKQFDHPIQVDLQNPHNMRPYLRWALYFNWLEQYKLRIIDKLAKLDTDFRKIYKVYEELRDIEDVKFMQEANVIGMTTTCAARLRTSLQALKSPIVIVEEAAEVLEAHIVAALTPNCQHLILIGDHQQLKPSAADYQIETKFKLGVSLFERMVLNKIQCFTLDTQHRMRPEISSLVKTTIYPFLKDHPSVEQRPPIRGTDHVLYFIDHQIYEQECVDHSKKNTHEAEFLLAYANHLILNGYKTDNITVIAAYLGQMFEMQRIRKRYPLLKNMRIAVLDNYQGEECDIILLSLVRSNKENKIGFLQIENRVCVALSRARNGMFIMGNMKQLISQSNLWVKINGILKEQDAIGSELSLRCEVHPDFVTKVKTADDFKKIPEGGCSQKCNFQLPCQHFCTKICHIVDRSHAKYKCREKCGRQLCDKDDTHKCTDMCYKECRPCYYRVLKKLPCGHEAILECSVDEEIYQCTIPVKTVLACGHEAAKPCHYDADKFPCPHPCEIKVEPCGHSCLLKCHINKDPDHLEYRCKKKCARFMKNCTQKLETHICKKLCYEECDECNIIVPKNRTICPHVFKVACSADVDLLECEKPCTKILQCGHKCPKKCNEPCGDCKKKVEKSVPICGHVITIECSKEPNRMNCKKQCPLALPCGHPCTKKCYEPCTPQCKSIVDDYIIGDCGHAIKQSYCYMKTTNNYTDSSKLLQLCKEPCTTTLKCGHKCSGTCGDCYQNRLHIRCKEKCGVPLVCNHECQFPCRSACRPCRLPCSFRCVHSKCGKLCGEPCTPCKEPCVRSCKHQKCEKLCGFVCDCEPCKEPCDLQLECGHDCVGFCNEPCPPCRICDTEGTYEVFFGTEEDEDARFVVLNDCKHVIENSAMEYWLGKDDESIGFKTCPKCKSLIKTTQRYSDYVKLAHQDIVKVQKLSVGSQKNNDKARQNLLQKITELSQRLPLNLRHLTNFGKLITDLIQRLRVSYRGQRQKFDKFILNGIERKYQIIQEILEICKFNKNELISDQLFDQQLDFITIGLKRDADYISDQLIDDLQQEIPRLLRIYEYNKLQQSAVFHSVKQNNSHLKNLVEQLEKSLLKSTRYVMDKEIQELLKKINTIVSGGLAISDTERRQIIAAMGLTKGHWYKCPNGHIYAIGECGGAMQESTCNECGAKIGGQSHQLRHDNRLAGEMDGAQYAAWSEQANLLNYDLN